MSKTLFLSQGKDGVDRMVLYFSGTGNSQFAALQIAEIIGDQTESINWYIKKGKKGVIHSELPFVFVVPTYSWRIPKVVEQWILNAELSGSQNAYFVLTCGGNCGNAADYTEKLCRKKKLHFYGLSSVLMPENYLALFPTPGKAECLEIMERAKPQISMLAEKIRSGEPFSKSVVSFADKLESGPVNPIFYKFFVKDKGFQVSNTCTSCGKCVRRCPLNNIRLVEGRPVWNGKCTHCMACIGGCPMKSIEYKTKSKNRHRYYIMNDSLCWKKVGQDH